jgi:hypothetical protein
MKFLRLWLIAFAIGFSTTSNAVTVKGMKSCGAWVKDRAEQPAPSLSTMVDSAWLDGYLSGVAVARNIDFLKGVDENTIKLWMDNYCSSHPLDLIGYAADALSIELKKRMH